MPRSNPKKRLKVIAINMCLLLLVQVGSPTVAFALTGGPTQPEVQGFQPMGATDLVDPFTGDFSYSIPLMDIDGYPLNLSYQSGVTMDQEASWVGLGWTLSPGAITRNMRGLPDDFSGEEVVKEFNVRDNWTAGVFGSAAFELFGIPAGGIVSGGVGLTLNAGAEYNNYNGFNLTSSISPDVALSASTGPMQFGVGVGLNDEGLTVSPTVSLTARVAKKYVTTKIGAQVNSRQGLTDLTLGGGFDGHQLKSGSIANFATKTYTPQLQFPIQNHSAVFSLGTGLAVFGTEVNVTLGGQYAKQSLMTNSLATRSFGYLYEDRIQDSNVLMDFNREKDIPFNKHLKNLPVTNHTFDLFSITGHGISGAFRPYRSQIGGVFDPQVKNPSISVGLDLEASATQLAQAGFNANITSSTSTSGDWSMDQGNQAGHYLRYTTDVQGEQPLYEESYFKRLGEMSVDQDVNDVLPSIGGTEPVRLELSGSGHSHVLDNRFDPKYVNNDAQIVSGVNNVLRRGDRDKRNQDIRMLTNAEASTYGISRHVVDYSSDRPNQIGEIQVTQEGGSRYIFGLPAMNHVQHEATFNIGNGTMQSDGLAGYTDSDASVGNSQGDDHYYNRQTLPSYAHSFLLTYVLSADYSDVDGEPGPSEGDLGTYVKFDYGIGEGEVMEPDVSSYNWRTPYSDRHHYANYDEGLKSNISDDKVNYVYGEKELWYTKTIETKTHVAEFFCSGRSDGYEATGEHGGTGTVDTMKKLDKIKLYTKAGYPDSPLKTVHFDYDYSLCRGVPNNQDPATEGGKLTLKKVFFTYGDNDVSALSPYVFDYAADNEALNQDYHPKAYDRWGNYKDPGGDLNDLMDEVSAAEYPYTEQGNPLEDEHASQWALRSIDLPSGGKITIDYEADDYAFVQDKRAMEMFKVVDSMDDIPASYSGNNTSQTRQLYGLSGNVREVLILELNEPAPTDVEERAKFTQRLFADAESGRPLYFRFLVKLDASYTNSAFSENFDYVTGYLLPQDGEYGLLGNTHAYMKVNCVRTRGTDPGTQNCNSTRAHPVSKAGWHFTQQFNRQIAYDLPATPAQLQDGAPLGPSLVNAVLQMNPLSGVIDGVRSPNGIMKADRKSRLFLSNKSWLRLGSPTGHKTGGGSRVSEVAISDQWAQMGGGADDFSYVREYDYELENGESSGVAAYEPMVGGEENPFRQPIYHKIDKLLAADDEHFVEGPMGESFFPSPVVGYSRVIERTKDVQGIDEPSTGHTEHRFYTSKDYPTHVDRTSLDMKYKPSFPGAQLFSFSARETMSTAQGYVVELNDMHGKPSEKWVVDGNGVRISGVVYRYAENDIINELDEYGPLYPGNATSISRTALDNSVLAIDKSGEILTHEIGLEVDMVNDYRRSVSESTTFTVQGNLASFLVAVFPAFLPPVYPKVSLYKQRYNSAVTTKVVNRYGILREVEVHDQESSIKTRNLLWDAETGGVLLTEITNAYDDSIYSLEYPAHWVYDGMGQAYKNSHVAKSGVLFNQAGEANIANAEELFAVGDELYSSRTDESIWVLKVNTGSIECVDKQGDPYATIDLPSNSLTDVKVVRSGRKNVASNGIQSVTSKSNPLSVDGAGYYTLADPSTLETLHSSAIEYSDDWMAPEQGLGLSLSEAIEQYLNDLLTYMPFDGDNSVPDYPDVLNGSELPYNEHHDFYTYLFGPEIPGHADLSLNPWITPLNGNNLHLDFSGDIECSVDFTMPTHTLIEEGGSGVPNVVLNIVSFDVLDNCYADTPPFEVLVDFGDRTLIGQISSDCFSDGYHYTYNPYVDNVRGQWRTKTTYTHLTDRTQDLSVNGAADLRNDGEYQSYTPFWALGTDGWMPYGQPAWTWAEELTVVNPIGMAVESKNALNIYTGVQPSNDAKRVMAEWNNARFNDCTYDGFEEYDDNYSPAMHSEFEPIFTIASEWHTGNKSMLVKPGTPARLEAIPFEHSPCASNEVVVPFVSESCDILPVFGPTKEGRYLLSYWVKEQSSSPLTNYTNHSLVIEVDCEEIVFEEVYVGPIIDGWQPRRIEFDYDPAMGGIAFVFGSEVNNSYIDDFRIQPYQSMLKSYAYDNETLRLHAILDENNFATFYEYDEEGNLTRVKKETERGIMTIQETRTAKAKIQP